MKVCYFGTYESEYPRNRVLIEGLKKNGIDVIEVHQSIWEKEADKTGKYLSFFSLLKLAFILTAQFACLVFKILPLIKKIDAIIVGYIGQLDVILAEITTFLNPKPIIFNPLISLYSTLVEDRRIFKKGSIQAKLIFLIDKLSFKLANLIIADTNQQSKYIQQRFNIEPRKIKRIFVGADERFFYPEEDKNVDTDKFKVLFYGKFTPLHGIEHIVKAAKILEKDSDMEFTIIGKGQLKREIVNLAQKLNLNNTTFIDWVSYEELKDYINSSLVCLGIFSNTAKAKRVIPNKIFQILATKKPLITADTPAVRELLKNGLNSLLCKPASEKALADSIQFLKNNPFLRENMSEQGYQTFRRYCNTRLLGRQLMNLLRFNE